MIERKTSMILVATILAGTILSGTTAMETSDLGPQTALDEELIIFCGAGFTGAMSEIGEIYGNSSNAQVRFNFDGLPALRVQIEEGAYADILISPDQSYMDPLVEEGFIDEESVQVFASNKVAVVLPIEELPIGDYALQVLDLMAKDPEYGPAFKEAVLANVVSLETRVTGIVSKVALGEADAGFAFMSDVSPQMRGKVRKIPIPEGYNVRGNCSAAVLSQSDNSEAAEAFIDLLVSNDAQAILDEYGFIPLSGSEENAALPAGDGAAVVN
ncbi:molybdate ABC transporter substrate-binding protein [Methanothrix sp.]|uniref:molybdate ABC transporter substrate-binding protein n=1 Tax=Methanothrix sp. TaxID=90426 RepID=UPI003298F716